MKIITLTMVVVIFAALTMSATAQDSTRVDKQMSALNEKLNLTEAQSDQIRSVLEKSAKKAEEARMLNLLSDSARFEMRKTHIEKRDRTINAVLDDDQKETYANVKDEVFGWGRGGPRLSLDEETQQLTGRLKLTREQSTKIAEILGAWRAERETLREQMRGGGGDRSQMMERIQAMRARRDEINAQVKALLNDEQKVEYQKYLEEQDAQMRQRMPGRGMGGPGGGPGR